jgi:hypothetical protein
VFSGRNTSTFRGKYCLYLHSKNLSKLEGYIKERKAKWVPHETIANVNPEKLMTQAKQNFLKVTIISPSHWKTKLTLKINEFSKYRKLIQM